MTLQENDWNLVLTADKLSTILKFILLADHLTPTKVFLLKCGGMIGGVGARGT